MAKTRKKGDGRFYRGTLPKKARSGTNCHEVYCNRCYCNYQVPVETNTDVWLNRHQAHFNCKEEKKARENLAVNQTKKRPRSCSSGPDEDRVFVLDGKTQESGTGTGVADMEELDIDPAVDFDIDVPDLQTGGDRDSGRTCYYSCYRQSQLPEEWEVEDKPTTTLSGEPSKTHPWIRYLFTIRDFGARAVDQRIDQNCLARSFLHCRRSFHSASSRLGSFCSV